MRGKIRRTASEKKKTHRPRGQETGGRFLIPGFHAVREALRRGGLPLNEIWIATGRPSARVREIGDLAAARGLRILEKPQALFDEHFPDTAHQGVAAVAASFAYADLRETAQAALETPGEGLLLALDHITDEGNLGALIRTAAFFGAQGLILPRDRSAGITPAVLKRASGACAILPIVQVVNLARAVEELKRLGFWIIGAAGESPLSVYGFDWRRPAVLLLGNEQKGLTPGVRKCCDEVVSVPVSGAMESLNVSVAGGVILAEIRRQQGAVQGSDPRGCDAPRSKNVPADPQVEG